MLLFSPKKRFVVMLAAYLAFSTMGMFTFVIFDSLWLDTLMANEPASGGYLTHADNDINSLAVLSAFNNKAGAQTALRHGPLRLVTPPGISAGALDFCCAAVKVKAFIVKRTLKNNILLKLRI